MALSHQFFIHFFVKTAQSSGSVRPWDHRFVPLATPMARLAPHWNCHPNIDVSPPSDMSTPSPAHWHVTPSKIQVFVFSLFATFLCELTNRAYEKLNSHKSKWRIQIWVYNHFSHISSEVLKSMVWCSLSLSDPTSECPQWIRFPVHITQTEGPKVSCHESMLNGQLFLVDLQAKWYSKNIFASGYIVQGLKEA